MLDRALYYFTIIAWCVFGIWIGYIFWRQTRSRGLWTALKNLLRMRRMLLYLAMLLLVTFVNLATVFIYPQYVGVVVSMITPGGIRPEPLQGGLNWIVPVVEHVVPYPISVQTYTMTWRPADGNHQGDDSIRCRTTDGQEVIIDCSFMFAVNPNKVVKLHIDWQNRYLEDLVRPMVRGVIRDYVAKYTVDEVNSSSRRIMGLELSGQLRRISSRVGLLMKNFILRNITFSEDYSHAVELKQVALEKQTQRHHEARQVMNLAEGNSRQIRILAQAKADAIRYKAEAQAQATIIRAQARQKALQLISNALQANKDLLTFQYIDNLPKDLNVMLLPDKTSVILPLPKDADQKSPYGALSGMDTPSSNNSAGTFPDNGLDALKELAPPPDPAGNLNHEPLPTAKPLTAPARKR